MRIAGSAILAVLASSLLAMKFHVHAEPGQEIRNEHTLDGEARQSLVALTRQADAIVVSKILSADSYWLADRTLILTDYQLQTVELLQGSVPSVFTIIAEGGVVDDVRLEVCEGVKLEPEASYVLFLQNQANRISALNGARGTYKVDLSQSLVKELKSIINSIEKESGDANQ